MDPKEEILLKENQRLLEENNRMLRYLYRSSKWSAFFSILKWIIVIAATIGLFYYFKPIFDSLGSMYQTITGHSLPNGFSSFFNK
jgi:hypothetical protein